MGAAMVPVMEDWITKKEAMLALRLADRQFREVCKAEGIRSMKQGVQGRKGPTVLYHAADVDRVVRARQEARAPIVMPMAATAAAHGDEAERRVVMPYSAGIVPPVGAEFVALVTDFFRSVSVPKTEQLKPPPIWLKLDDAAAVSGLPKGFILAQIEAKRLPALDISRPGSARRRWRVKAADLEALPGSTNHRFQRNH